MIIEREIEICTTERMIHKWNLFTYSRDIENNPRLEVFWKNFAEDIYRIPDNNHKIQLEEIEKAVEKCLDGNYDVLAGLFKKESDWSDSSMLYGSILFLQNIRHQQLEMDICDNVYFGCSQIISSLMAYFLGKKICEDKQDCSIVFNIVKNTSNFDILYGCRINMADIESFIKQKIDFKKMIMGDRWSSAKDKMDEFDKENDAQLLLNYEHFSPHNVFYPTFYEWDFLIPTVLELKRYDLILSLLLKLKYPFFQNEVLHYLLRDDCLALCREIMKNNPPKRLFLTALLLEQWLLSLVKFGELLDDYDNKKNTDSELKKIIESSKQRMLEYHKSISSDISLFIEILGISYVVKYIFSKKMITPLKETGYIKNHNNILSLVQKNLLECKDFDQIAHSELDITSLLFLIQKQSILNDKEKTREAMNVLDEKIRVSNSFLSIDLSEPNINLMRMYRFGLLKFSSTEIIERVKKFRVSFEGYDIKDKSKYISCEIFVLCSMALLYEDDMFFDKIPDFKQVLLGQLTEHILNQIYRCDSDYLINKYYITSLQLLKMVVEQIYQEGKDWFDEQIIGLDSLKMILLVLQYNTRELSKLNLDKLNKRLQDEWEYEKKMYLSKDKNLSDQLDKIAKRITKRIVQ